MTAHGMNDKVGICLFVEFMKEVNVNFVQCVHINHFEERIIPKAIFT